MISGTSDRTVISFILDILDWAPEKPAMHIVRDVQFPDTRSPSTILLIEDDRQTRDALRSELESEGFAVVEAYSRKVIFEYLERYPIALITLEIRVDNSSGFDLTREIRSRLNVPIIIITSEPAPIDRVAILESGADDYVTKPFHIKEVVLRIRALLRRYGPTIETQITQPTIYSFDGGLLDTRKRELRRTDDNSLVELTQMEFKILELFLHHPARVLSRDEINQALRGHEWSPNDRTIDGHIARLRHKLEPESDRPKLIKSVRGIGYIFCG
jgi:two-component system, OmpR family, response regulator